MTNPKFWAGVAVALAACQAYVGGVPLSTLLAITAIAIAIWVDDRF